MLMAAVMAFSNLAGSGFVLAESNETELAVIEEAAEETLEEALVETLEETENIPVKEQHSVTLPYLAGLDYGYDNCVIPALFYLGMEGDEAVEKAAELITEYYILKDDGRELLLKFIGALAVCDADAEREAALNCFMEQWGEREMGIVYDPY